MSRQTFKKARSPRAGTTRWIKMTLVVSIKYG
jgi:hypothetical protein